MPSTFKGGQGATPTPCLDSPITPDLGANPPAGPALWQADPPMVSVADPFQPCGPPDCPASSCCGGGDSGGLPGGGLPPMLLGVPA
jgi:hypothetical protein